MKRTLYECMEPSITSAFISRSLDDPVTEIQDFDRVIQFYWARIRRFILASVRDRDVAETLTQECFWSAYRSRMSGAIRRCTPAADSADAFEPLNAVNIRVVRRLP